MKDLLRILIALLVWLATFSAIYGLHGLACSQHSDLLGAFGLEPATIVLIAAWLAATLLQVGVLAGLRRWPSRSEFVNRIAMILGWTAIIAMVWSLFPVLLPLGCG